MTPAHGLGRTTRRLWLSDQQPLTPTHVALLPRTYPDGRRRDRGARQSYRPKGVSAVRHVKQKRESCTTEKAYPFSKEESKYVDTKTDATTGLRLGGSDSGETEPLAVKEAYGYATPVGVHGVVESTVVAN